MKTIHLWSILLVSALALTGCKDTKSGGNDDEPKPPTPTDTLTDAEQSDYSEYSDDSGYSELSSRLSIFLHRCIV